MRVRKSVVVAVLFAAMWGFVIPAGAAVDKTNSVITDPVDSTRQARVVGGALNVGDGTGPLTVDGTVGVGGPVTVNGRVGVDGPVEVRPALSGALTKAVTVFPRGGWETLGGPFPAGQEFALSAATFFNENPYPVYVNLTTFELLNGQSDCGPSGVSIRSIINFTVNADDYIHLTYPQPMVLPGTPEVTRPWCLETAQTTLDPDPNPRLGSFVAVTGFVV